MVYKPHYLLYIFKYDIFRRWGQFYYNVVHLFIMRNYSWEWPCYLFYSMICHKNHPNLLHNPTLAMSSLLQILYIITNNFFGTRLWVTVKCLDIHTLSLATHQTPNSNMSLPRAVSSRISQVMVLVHHRCLALQPWHHYPPIIQDLLHQCHSILRQCLLKLPKQRFTIPNFLKVINMKMMIMMNHTKNNYQPDLEDDLHVELEDIDDFLLT